MSNVLKTQVLAQCEAFKKDIKSKLPIISYNNWKFAQITSTVIAVTGGFLSATVKLNPKNKILVGILTSIAAISTPIAQLQYFNTRDKSIRIELALSRIDTFMKTNTDWNDAVYLFNVLHDYSKDIE